MSYRPNVRAFRKAQQESKDARGGGTKTPWEAYIFSMDPGETAPIRFLPPLDDEIFIRKSHGFPSETCTAEIPGFNGRCVYCYWNERDETFRGSWYASIRTVMSIIDFRFSHWDLSKEKPEVHTCHEADPNPKRSTCRHCNSSDPAIAERHFGGQKRWEMTDDQRDQVMEVFGKLQRVCIAQSDPNDPASVCGQKIDEIGYCCSNPDCGAEILSERDIQTKDCADIISNEYECPDCKKTDWPMPMLICNSEKHTPIPATIYDKVLEVSCSGTTKTDKKGRERTKKTFNFDRNIAPWSTLKDDLEFFGITGEAQEKMMTPDDLLKRFAPFRLDPSGYAGPEEYAVAVLKKQAEHCKKPLPPGWDEVQGARSTGRSMWTRQR